MVLLAGLSGKVADTDGVLRTARDMCGADASVQLMRASMVFGRIHLESATDHAIRAFEQGRNTSNSLATETLLYASGTRQIDKAIEKMGIRKGDSEVALVAFGKFSLGEFLEEAGFKRDDSVLEGDASMLTEYGITEKEVASVPESKVFDLVLERVAMVDLQR
jgi:KEOPS complex subunit Cgi121